LPRKIRTNNAKAAQVKINAKVKSEKERQERKEMLKHTSKNKNNRN